MSGAYSKGYLRLAWITLVFIFLVIIAGSVVRSTGSGMGCPDWPKCFDQIIPPTSADQLPADYKDTYRTYRQEKVEKFASFIERFGFDEVAENLRNDETLLIEQDFNALKTWVEYGNRLVGFIAGNCVLILFIWTFIRYRLKRKLLLLTFLNLVLMGIEAWFGSIVVATNLVPWTITLHMFLAIFSLLHRTYKQFLKLALYVKKISRKIKYLTAVCVLQNSLQNLCQRFCTQVKKSRLPRKFLNMKC